MFSKLTKTPLNINDLIFSDKIILVELRKSIVVYRHFILRR